MSKHNRGGGKMKVTNVRYGEPGKILFDIDGVIHETQEPIDVLPVGYSVEAANKWALKRVFSNNYKKVGVKQ